MTFVKSNVCQYAYSILYQVYSKTLLKKARKCNLKLKEYVRRNNSSSNLGNWKPN
nr:MAG TPA: hypothetical protein [Microviridae sp.]